MTPIEPSLIQRIVDAGKYVIAGVTPNTWMGPNQPLQPVAQQAQGRIFDYPTSFNLNNSPRGNSSVTNADLRFLASSWDLLRGVIETRKDQLEGLDWQVRPKENSKLKPDDAIVVAANEFLQNPSTEYTWQQWLRAIAEDMFVLDQVALYKWRTKGGKIFSFDPIDAATIKHLIDGTGRKPIPPSPAYQQILKGMPAVDYTTEQLIVRSRNTRTYTPFGYSPVEQVITTVNIAVRRTLYQLDYYKEGNIPAGLVSVPKEWSPDNIATFAKYWDAKMKGNSKERTGLQFVPGDTKYQEIVQPPMKDAYDEWLARIVCYVFSVPPSPFIKEMNRATADSSNETSLEQGLKPVKKYLRGILTEFVRTEFSPELEFAWVDDEEVDPLVEAQVQKLRVESGLRTIDELRTKDGLDGFGGQASRPNITTATGMVPIKVDMDDQGKKIDPKEFEPDEPVEGAGGKPGDKKQQDTTEKVEAGGDAVLKKALESLGFMAMASNVHAVAALTPSVAKVLSDCGQDVAAQYLALQKSDDEEEFDLSVLAGLEDVMPDQLGKVARKAAESSILSVGISGSPTLFGQINIQAATWAKGRVAELVSEIDETTRDQLATVIEDGLADGQSIDQIAQSIRDSAAFSEERAKLIAETEVGNAEGGGALLGLNKAKEIGVDVSKQWLPAGNACIICTGNAAQGPIPIDQPFASGDMAPLGHPRCKCTMFGVVGKIVA